jgi:hypothetical protein
MHKISIIWEGELDKESLTLFKESPAECVEFMDVREDTRLVIEENGVVIFEYKQS